ncbi:MAG: sulfite exporter TauE/SafE family protein, partial [Nitrosomonas sp.]|nr:sulfite exporter TauE/SafE family protein [Nitrosomonas sp.]
MEIYLIPFLLGSLTGMLLALTGAGGAILAVPLLIFGLQLAVAEAAPIALLAVCLSATMGATIALIQGKVRYRAAGFIAIIGVIASPIGIWLAQKLPNAPLTLLFAAVLVYVAVDMFRDSVQGKKNVNAADTAPQPCLIETADGRLIWTWTCARALALSGSVAGFLSGLL